MVLVDAFVLMFCEYLTLVTLSDPVSDGVLKFR